MLLMAGGALGQSVPEGAVIIGNEIGVKELSTREVRQYMRGESSRWKGGSDYSVTVVLPSTKLPECAYVGISGQFLSPFLLAKILAQSRV